MIACGWCGAGTESDRCSNCGRDPEQAYTQRNRTPLVFNDHSRRLADARKRLTASGRAITVDRLAEEIGVDARTVRRWQQMSAK